MLRTMVPTMIGNYSNDCPPHSLPTGHNGTCECVPGYSGMDELKVFEDTCQINESMYRMFAFMVAMADIFVTYYPIQRLCLVIANYTTFRWRALHIAVIVFHISTLFTSISGIILTMNAFFGYRFVKLQAFPTMLWGVSLGVYFGSALGIFPYLWHHVSAFRFTPLEKESIKLKGTRNFFFCANDSPWLSMTIFIVVTIFNGVLVGLPLSGELTPSKGVTLIYLCNGAFIMIMLVYTIYSAVMFLQFCARNNLLQRSHLKILELKIFRMLAVAGGIVTILISFFVVSNSSYFESRRFIYLFLIDVVLAISRIVMYNIALQGNRPVIDSTSALEVPVRNANDNSASLASPMLRTADSAKSYYDPYEDMTRSTESYFAQSRRRHEVMPSSYDDSTIMEDPGTRGLAGDDSRSDF